MRRLSPTLTRHHSRHVVVPAPFLLTAVALVQVLAAPVQAGDTLETPRRITAGDANAYMGVPSPDGRRIFFVSDHRSTTSIHSQAPDRGGPAAIIQENADVLAPRPSPDGRTLLYIDTARDAGGDACLMDLETGDRRCLTGLDTADVDAFWFPDGRFIGVLQRGALHDDFVLRRLPITGGPVTDIVRANLATPSISADGTYLAWVPLERDSEQVGINFAMRLGRGIVFHRLSDGVEFSFSPPLPGYSGFPAFSPDGHHFLFAQYLNDTNFDGRIDGRDNGVLFRVAFDAKAPSPFQGPPEQLSSARFNCLYPAPGPGRLVATCSDGNNLNIFTLPPEGSIPTDWDLARIDEQIAASRDQWEQLMLMGRAQLLEPDVAGRLVRLRAMADLHTRLKEYESADFYARRSADLAGRGAREARWAGVLRELIAHRVGEARLVQGQVSETFLADARQRLSRLPLDDEDVDVAALALLLDSEIRDVAGDEAGARQAFARISPDRLTDAATIRMLGERAARLLALPWERPALLDLLRTLSLHPAAPPADRLMLADAFVTTAVRGATQSGRAAAVQAALAVAPEGSELAFRLDLERRLIPIGRQDPETLRAEVFALYRAEKDPLRRRFLVLDTVRRAAAKDQEYVMYQFANTWVAGLRPGSAERPYGEALYREVAMDRAYATWAADDVAEARGWFWGATLQGDPLEAHIGFIETRLAEGVDDLDETYLKRFASDPNGPAAAFVRAYRATRSMGNEAADVDRIAKAVSKDVKTAVDAWPSAWEPHLLRGWIAHQRLLRRTDPDLASEARNEYGLALDLARESPRGLATILLNLGLLQATLGDDSAALDTLGQRDALPYDDPAGRFTARVAQARSLFRTERFVGAAAASREAVDLVHTTPTLARFLPIALDRAALYALAAAEPAVALGLLDELAPMADTMGGPNAIITQFKFELKRSSAALAAGRHQLALDATVRAQDLLARVDPWPRTVSDGLGGPPTTRVFSRADAEGLLTAFRAHALAGLDRLPEAIDWMGSRKDGLVDRLRRLDLDEDVLELARVEYHIGKWTWALGQRESAVSSFEAGLARAQAFSARTGTPVTIEGLRLVETLAQARWVEGVPADRFHRDTPADVEEAHDAIGANRNPRWDADRFLLEQYRVLAGGDAKR